MSERNVIQTTFDEFGKASAGRKKSGSWYRRSEETVFVLNLQKSNYAARYYINVAVWLLALGATDTPKENKCQVRSRLTQLVPDELESRVNELLDLDFPMEETARKSELLAVLDQHLQPLMDAGATIKGLRSATGQALIRKSLVTGPAQRLLAADK